MREWIFSKYRFSFCVWNILLRYYCWEKIYHFNCAQFSPSILLCESKSSQFTSKSHATINYAPSFNRRKNTSKACPIVRQTCQKSSVIKLSTVFSSKMHWKRVRVVPVRYNGDSFHWFWQPWVTPLLLGLPLVPAKLLLRLKFPAMNPAPKT